MTPCLVLHDGVWLPGAVEAWRRDATGWRAFVRYQGPMTDSPFSRRRYDVTELLGQYLQWRPASEVRPV